MNFQTRVIVIEAKSGLKECEPVKLPGASINTEIVRCSNGAYVFPVQASAQNTILISCLWEHS
jgi:hypothetical protein